MNKVINVNPLSDGVLQVRFADGSEGCFDVKPFMVSDYFYALNDPDYFSKVGLFFSGVGWPDGQDLGPDTIFAHLKR